MSDEQSATQQSDSLPVDAALLEQAGVCLLVLDDRWRVQMATAAISAMTGHPSDTLIGTDWWSLVDDAPREALPATTDAHSCELRLRTTAGAARWVRYSHVKHADGTYHVMLQDIHAQKTHETAHYLLQALIDALPDAIQAKDTDGRYILSNRPHAAILEADSPADVIGKRGADFLTPEISQRFEEEDQDVIHGDLRIHQAERTIGAKTLMASKLPVTDETGAVVAVLGIARDITAMRQAELALRASQDRHETLLETLPETMVIIQRDGAITDVHVNEGDNPLPTDDREYSLATLGLSPAVQAQAKQAIERVLANDQMQTVEFKMQAEDDTQPRFFEARLARLSQDEVLALIRNITPFKRIQQELNANIKDLETLRQVNQELSATMELSIVVEFALDYAVRVTHADAGFIALVQADGALKLGHLIGNYDRAQVKALLDEKRGVIPSVLQEQAPRLLTDVHQHATYAPARDSTTALMVVPLISQDRLVGVVQVESRQNTTFSRERFDFLQLITARIANYIDNANLYRQTQEQLRQLELVYEDVRYLEQIKTDMIRLASHDIKSPLGQLMGYLELLRIDLEADLNATQRRQFDDAQKSARAMMRITSSILSIERIEEMAIELTMEEFDLRELVENSIAEYRLFIEQKEQNLAQQLHAEPITIHGDPILLHQAITNLISNAIKYTPKDGTIHITLQRDDEMVYLRVQDTGYGIPESEQKRLFTPFFRASMHETEGIDGTGLGLHLVKNIIVRHRGEMYFTSEYGKGSTFGFDLPLLNKRPT